MHMRMADEGLPPGVEDAQHANFGAEMFRIRRDLTECRGARLKEPGVQTGAISIDQWQERMWHGEDDVYIRHVEELALTCVQAALAGLRLAFRAVAIPTRVVRDGLMPAGATPVEMPPERRRATAHDGAEHGVLLHAEPGMLLDEGVALRMEDIGHLHGRPAHDGSGLRRSRDRGRTTGVGTSNCSRGFGAACR